MTFDAKLRQTFTDALGMWRFRWPAMAIAWIVAVIIWIWVLSLPDQFQARSRVYVDTESVLAPLMQGLTVETDTISQVQLMTRALLSRPQLQAVALETGLEMRAKTPEDFEKLLVRLEQMISIDGSSTPQLFSISYSDHDPVMARAVVSSLLDRFMVESLGETRKDSKLAQGFIERRIEDDERRLYDAEMRLAEFKKANVGLLPGAEGDYFSKLAQSQADVRNIEARMRLLQQRRNELLRQLEGEEPTFGLVSPAAGDPFGSKASSSVDAAIANVEARIRDMLLRLTDKHPDVVRARETLNDLQKIRDEELAGAPAPVNLPDTVGQSSTSALDMNPVYQHMRIELSESDVEMVTLQAELADKKRSLAFLQQQVDAIPEVEAELTRLNRDYNVIKSRHEAMLARLESARLAEDLQVDNEKIAFRVIDPPFVPIDPSGPNRLPMLLAGLLVALGAGGAVSYLLNLQFPAFFSAQQLGNFSGLPVFGVISDFSDRSDRRSDWMFAAATAGLVAACMTLIIVENSAVDIVRAVGKAV